MLRFIISIERANLHLTCNSFYRNSTFYCNFLGKKNGIRDNDKKGRDAGFSWKRSGNAGSGPPLPDPLFTLKVFVFTLTEYLVTLKVLVFTLKVLVFALKVLVFTLKATRFDLSYLPRHINQPMSSTA